MDLLKLYLLTKNNVSKSRNNILSFLRPLPESLSLTFFNSSNTSFTKQLETKHRFTGEGVAFNK